VTHAQARRLEVLNGRKRKPKKRRGAGGARQPAGVRGGRKAMAAGRRLGEVLSFTRRDISMMLGAESPQRNTKARKRARRVALLEPHFPEFSALQSFRREHKGVSKVFEYCRYVGSLITASGVADALGMPRTTVADYLGKMTRAGWIRGQRRKELARRATVWDWVGE
jgi:hypothetical protein